VTVCGGSVGLLAVAFMCLFFLVICVCYTGE